MPRRSAFGFGPKTVRFQGKLSADGAALLNKKRNQLYLESGAFVHISDADVFEALLVEDAKRNSGKVGKAPSQGTRSAATRERE